MPDPSLLRALFRLPPEDAIRHLEAKGLRLTFNWHEMLDEAHARAFTVAKAGTIDLLQDMRGGLLGAMREGLGPKEFEARLKPLLQAKGWWGKAVVVDPDTLDAQLVQLGSSRRLRTIYQTNMQAAFMAGRYKRQMEAKGFPYLMYVAVMDSHTRPSHALLNGRVFAKDDPAMAKIYPPNGFNCRCRTRALTAGQVAREGRTVETETHLVEREINAGVDKVTGEISKTRQTGIRLADPITGRDKVMWVDAGFNASPAASHLMDDLLYRKAERGFGRGQALEWVGQMLASEPRLRAWRAFVSNTLAFGRPQQRTAPIGLMPEKLIETGFAPLAHVADPLLAGPKARRHEARGDAPTRDEWAALPADWRVADWYLDRDSGNAVALLGNGLAALIDQTGAVDTLYRDKLAQMKIANGRWRKLER